MNLGQFRELIKKSIPTGTILDNPGKGTSEIVKYSDKNIFYIRKNSTISVAFEDLFAVYLHYKGQRVSSSDLRSFAPKIFDSSARPAGHSCNCTFFFMILSHLDLSGKIEGKGKSGSPFTVNIF